jgi:hypothetical protein
LKEKPSSWEAWAARVKKTVAPGNLKRSLFRLADDGFVKLGILPEMMDGAGKILHMSDTPTNIYGYLARVLRRVNPSVVVHTGDLADDVKLGMFPSEAKKYGAEARRLFNILLAPHRTVIVALGNHDRADLFPPLPPQCVVCDNMTRMTLFGANFGISHYIERVIEKPERFNLFGHDPSRESFIDDGGRYFFNGTETMRVIDPATGEIKTLLYPDRARSARSMRGGRLVK